MTFLFVSLAWVMFRAPDVDTALNLYASMLGANGFVPPALFADIIGFQGETLATLTGFEGFALAGLLWWVWTKPNVHEIDPTPTIKRAALMAGASAMILVSITQPSSFIYWNF
jgi:hypothetical protein